MRKSKEMPVCVNMAPGVRGDPMAAGRGTPPCGRSVPKPEGRPGEPPLRVPAGPRAPGCSPEDAGAS